MAAIHHHQRRTPAERDVDAAVRVAWSHCRALEGPLDELGAHIVQARRLAASAAVRNVHLRGPEPVHVPAAQRRRWSARARLALARVSGTL